eukprot:CAMPEP_0196581848 /NCGR_PEP_ID=MMETSP1081-20130531/35951_1 /TAXON_ID=36882 /ORGANISM="Pyramimonas amylifera, Strain CCMP720" /LENGTH=374 /DNA_ID=CAMNT_0041902225 /DNA_START=121 /DNA_END=1245 /DNA_ORIENTATION=+
MTLSSGDHKPTIRLSRPILHKEQQNSPGFSSINLNLISRNAFKTPSSKYSERGLSNTQHTDNFRLQASLVEDRVIDKSGFGGVVVTGGAGGVGFAMAREFASQGYSVVICDISEERVQAAASTLGKEHPSIDVTGVQCDVGEIEAVKALKAVVSDKLGGQLVAWINNAGTNGGRVPLIDLPANKVTQVVDTNLKGVLLTTQAALQVMADQPDVHGHIFNVVGSGCRGEATPGYSAYGATKFGMMQLEKTLNKEIKEHPRLRNKVSLHNMSPGMVFTDLLLNDSTPKLRSFFDVLASEPEEVAADLVSKMLAVIPTKKTGEFVQFLTPDKIFTRMANGFLLGKKPGRFDKDGNRVRDDGAEYSENGVRIQFKRDY